MGTEQDLIRILFLGDKKLDINVNPWSLKVNVNIFLIVPNPARGALASIMKKYEDITIVVVRIFSSRGDHLE